VTVAGAGAVPDVLARIVARRRERLAAEPAPPGPAAAPERETPLAAADNAFLAALAAPREGRAAVIAEVKMGSPRIGTLAGRVDPEAQARLYAAGGAAALSVVVEPDWFGGSYELLARCREASGLPAVAKDFLVDERQLAWAREAGADAVLLVAVLYGREELARWARRARGLGLAPLVETHGAEDAAKLRGAEWELVGVNNRDLRTFEVDLEQSIERVRELPPGALKVAESGIGGGADVARLAAAGFDAFLVGESLLLAEDPAAKLAELVGMGRDGGRGDG
jgi:indole-3-glycerol phosphate synthase